MAFLDTFREPPPRGPMVATTLKIVVSTALPEEQGPTLPNGRNTELAAGEDCQAVRGVLQRDNRSKEVTDSRGCKTWRRLQRRSTPVWRMVV